MKQLLLILFLIVSLEASSKQILLLQSYNKGLKWSDDLSKGVEAVLLKNKKYELTTEYMDSKKNFSKEYAQTINKLFYEKFQEVNYDVVIVADNYAIDFVQKNKNKLFKDAKIIFCGLDKDSPGILINDVLEKGIPVILENKQIKTNIDFIFSSLPNLEYLYIINDLTLSSRLINHRIKDAIKNLNKDIKVKISLDGDVIKIKEDFLKLPNNSAVLFGSLFLDNKGKYMPFYEVNDLLNSSPVPIFSLTNSHFGKGVIGGLLSTGYEQGFEAASLVHKLINNKKIDLEKPIMAKAKWSFDYNILKKYELEKMSLPKNSTLLNAPQSFFEKNRELVDRAFLVFPFVVIFLLIAVINILKRRRVEKKLIAQSYLQKVLLNNIHSFVFWIDKQGYIQGCNDSFCDFFEIEECQVIGKNINSFFEKLDMTLSKEDLLALKNIEFSHEKKDFIIRNKTFLDEDENDAGIVSIITDISEKKQLEINKQFIIQQSKLSEIGVMLSAMTHQWKVSLVELSAVAHKMQYYQAKKSLSDEDINYFFETIMNQIIFMGDTIDGFRAFIKPSSKPMLFNVNLGIKEILSILSSSLKYNNIKSEFINHVDLEQDLFGYPNEFKQVILNIINNAKESILEQRINNPKCGNIKILLAEKDDYLSLIIKDDGKGIEKDVLPRVFDSFYTTKKNGDGIGLYMAKLIIEKKMSGSIKAESLDEGASFIIKLPIIALEDLS